MLTLFTNALKGSAVRQFHTRAALRYPAGLENILGGGPAPPVQVKSIGEEGIQLADGLVIPSACIFLDGQVFLWNVPSKPWKDWTKDHFRIFDAVVPKPGTSCLGLYALFLTFDTTTRDSPPGYWEIRRTITSDASKLPQPGGDPGGCNGHGSCSCLVNK
jgi:hypothetical protein